ncbi:MAG: YraN family protein [Patescibacteria group bacterium]
MIFWKKIRPRRIRLWRKKNLNIGSEGEEVAAGFLKEKGYKILVRNFKNLRGRQLGEIDIIAEKNKEIVFIEVKTRELEKYGKTLPEENITFSKLRKLNKIANSYIKMNNLWNYPYHFDAVSVWLSHDFKKFEIKHIEDIFI